MSTTPQTLDTTEREIASTRMLNAPRELVWDVWTKPEHIIHWWGPNGFTNTIDVMDVKPGGQWEFIMHGPDGTDYRNVIVYTEVVRPERLAYDHVSGPKFHATVIFTAFAEKTEVSMRMVFETKEIRDRTAKEFGAVEGQKQTLARLSDYLDERAKELA